MSLEFKSTDLTSLQEIAAVIAMRESLNTKHAGAGLCGAERLWYRSLTRCAIAVASVRRDRRTSCINPGFHAPREAWEYRTSPDVATRLGRVDWRDRGQPARFAAAIDPPLAKAMRPGTGSSPCSANPLWPAHCPLRG
jgi:hypothetical protein